MKKIVFLLYVNFLINKKDVLISECGHLEGNRSIQKTVAGVAIGASALAMLSYSYYTYCKASPSDKVKKELNGAILSNQWAEYLEQENIKRVFSCGYDIKKIIMVSVYFVYHKKK